MKWSRPDGVTVTKRLAWLVAELLVVFIGVFAAFLLDDARSHRRDLEQRRQILAALHQYFTGLLEEIENGGLPQQTAWSAAFLTPYDAGEMPDLQALTFVSGFESDLWQSMLQSGGGRVLEVDLVVEIEGFMSFLRWWVETMRRYQRLSDQWILPHSGQDKSTFYDTESGQLRTAYEWYEEFHRKGPERMKRLEKAVRALIERLEQAAPELAGAQ